LQELWFHGVLSGNAGEQAMNESKVKKCPKCGGEMEVGYLRNAQYWINGKGARAKITRVKVNKPLE
jgi:hypothetical protein